MKIKDVDVLYFYCLKWLILPIQKKAKGFQNFKVYGQIHSKGEPLPTSITNHQAQTSMEHNNVQSSVQTNLFTHTTHLSNFLLQPITYSMSQNQKSLQLINIFLQSSIELMWLPIMTLAISIGTTLIASLKWISIILPNTGLNDSLFKLTVYWEGKNSTFKCFPAYK